MIIDRHNKILEAKEQRIQTVNELLGKYNFPVIVFVLNIPGENKNPSWADRLHRYGHQEFLEKIDKNRLELIFSSSIDSIAGRESFFILNEDPQDLKKLCIKIEDEAPINRLFDFDVHVSSNIVISRQDLGIAPRKCLVCDEPAHSCARSLRHSSIEIMWTIENLLKYTKI